jgi:hypothetical protein
MRSICSACDSAGIDMPAVSNMTRQMKRAPPDSRHNVRAGRWSVTRHPNPNPLNPPRQTNATTHSRSVMHANCCVLESLGRDTANNNRQKNNNLLKHMKRRQAQYDKCRRLGTVLLPRHGNPNFDANEKRQNTLADGQYGCAWVCCCCC